VHRCPVDTTSDIGKAPQSTVGLSVGVLLADAKTPIFFMQNLVEQLLKSAKRRAKELKKHHDYFGGTIDFMALKAVTMITSSLKEFRDSSLRVGADRLTARPYTLTEMQQLLETVRTLKTTAFPRSQLYALRRDLWEGRWASTVNYLYFTERLGECERTQLRTVLDQRWCKGGAAPWRPIGPERAAETVLVDLIELYDFVEE
jgi:CRISPR-associated protein Cmr2